jgi:hypothetical protein
VKRGKTLSYLYDQMMRLKVPGPLVVPDKSLTVGRGPVLCDTERHYSRRTAMDYRLLALLVSASLLTGCANQPGAFSKYGSGADPHANTASADWDNLGVSPNGNILNEIDKLSIKKQGALVSFRDRKTIFNIKKENFLSTPRHKVSLNYWQIDCTDKTYKLTGMILFDENGRQVASFTYNDSQIKPMPVVQNSASFQQMQYVCPGPSTI